MKKLALAGVSLVAVVLLVLGSQTNVVGYQTVQTSQQELLNERVNQKDLLFDLIIDIANNPEIRKTVFEAQLRGGVLLPLPYRVTKAQLNMLYVLGFFLSRTLDRTKIGSSLEQPRIWNPVLQERLSTIIMKDSRISQGIAQLSDSDCYCDDNKVPWGFPIICNITHALWIVSLFIYNFIIYNTHSFRILGLISFLMLYIYVFIARYFHCSWPWFSYSLPKD